VNIADQRAQASRQCEQCALRRHHRTRRSGTSQHAACRSATEQVRGGVKLNTPKLGDSATGFTRVIMPIHPLFGMQLRVVRLFRATDGRRMVDVENPLDYRASLRLPIDWTDLGNPPPVACIDGRCPRLSPEAARRLATAVQARIGMLIVSSGASCTGMDVRPDAPDHEQDSCAEVAHGIARGRNARSRDPRGRSGRVGHSRVQGSSARQSKTRGGKS